MKKIKPPSLIVLLIAAVAAFWVADIINPGFNPVGVMIMMLIPVFIIDYLYPDTEAGQVMEIEQFIEQQRLIEQQEREKIKAEAAKQEEFNLAEEADVEALVS